MILHGIHAALPQAAIGGGAADATGEALGDIQMFPPGLHEICASTHDGEKWEGEVLCDAQAAADMQRGLAEMLAAAAAGTGPEPYLDFNHDDEAASAHPQEIYWGGDDPQKGGIRCKVRWTIPGKNAVTGRSFTRFSPTFAIGADQRPQIAGPNMGGLVNRPAFTTISKVSAKSAESITMTAEEIKALQDNLEAAQAELDGMKTKVLAAQADRAAAVVEAAVANGRLDDTPAVRAKWVEALTRDESLVALLPAAPAALPLPAPIQARAASAAGASAAPAVLKGTPAEIFAGVCARAEAAGKGFIAAAQSMSDAAYRAYREQLVDTK